MRYRAYLDGVLFFDASAGLEETALSSAVLNLEYGKAGSFSFSVEQTNLAYDDIARCGVVTLYRDDSLIFGGRIYSVTSGFYKTKNVEVEGWLAYLNDSIARPFTTPDGGTFSALLTTLLTSHNSQVESGKQISVGTIDSTLASASAYRKYESYESTFTRISDLVDSFGGYPVIRQTNSQLYLDWPASIDTALVQSIDFGENLLDVNLDSNINDFCTVLIPLGADYTDEQGNQTCYDITSVTTGNVDYLEADATTISTYGRIVAVNKWSDVTTPANLKAKGQAYLNAHCVPKTSISVSAIDLGTLEDMNRTRSVAGIAVVGRTIVGNDSAYVASYIDVGCKIKVTSAAHGLDGSYFNILSRSLNLLNPASDKITLTATRETMAAFNRKTTRKNVTAITDLGTFTNGEYKTNKQRIDTLDSSVSAMQTEYTSSIKNLGDKITAEVERVDTLEGTVSSTSSRVEQTESSITVLFEKDDTINSWFTFSDNEFTIQKAGSNVKSVQTASSFEYMDGENTLMRLDTDGLKAKEVNVVGQLKVSEGSEETPTDRWSIRKGALTNNKINLDIVWIGG